MKKHTKVQWAPGQVSAKQKNKKNPPKLVWEGGHRPLQTYSAAYHVQSCDELLPGMLFNFNKSGMFIQKKSESHTRDYKYPVIRVARGNWPLNITTATQMREEFFMFVGMLEELLQVDSDWHPAALKVPVFLWSKDSCLYSIPYWSECLALI